MNGMAMDEEGRMRPSIAFGVFYTQRYRQDQPCVLYQGAFSRGGAVGNRWHTSIKVRDGRWPLPTYSCVLRTCMTPLPCPSIEPVAS